MWEILLSVEIELRIQVIPSIFPILHNCFGFIIDTVSLWMLSDNDIIVCYLIDELIKIALNSQVSVNPKTYVIILKELIRLDFDDTLLLDD
jgi:hypothetical protein